MTDTKSDKKFMRILWAICLIPLIIGIILVVTQTETTVYPTDEYWVAQDYHHVYERSSGEIVDYIESDEKCKIKGEKIIVTKHGSLYLFGGCLIGLFGLATIGCIAGAVSTGDWRINRNTRD